MAFTGFMEQAYQIGMLTSSECGILVSTWQFNDRKGRINMTEKSAPAAAHDDKKVKFEIQIDRAHFAVTAKKLTGAELRALPNPDIGPDRDLFEVIPGQPDRLIGNTESVEIRNGKRFFTAPSHINPGSRRT